MSSVRSVLLSAATVASLSWPVASAWAADDGYENVFSSVLETVGVLKHDESPDIDYRERAPLVLPPKMALQKPLPESTRTAAWPQDPDVLRRRRAEAEARAPSILGLRGNHTETASGEELRRAGISGEPNETATRANRCGAKGNQRGCLVLSPDQLAEEDARAKAAGFGGDDKTELVAGQEPERLYLTQPPKGYLKATKTVKATTEAPVIKLDQARPSSELVYKEKTDE